MAKPLPRKVLDQAKMLRALAAPVDAGSSTWGHTGSPGTLRDYLRTLLIKVWQEEQGFNGKRPFGNSGWQAEVYEALIRAGVLEGELDEDGFLERVDYGEGEALVVAAIKHVFGDTDD